MFVNIRDMITNRELSLLIDQQEAIEDLILKHDYHQISDSNYKSRILRPYVETSLFIQEAINLEQISSGGYINLKERSGRRKDRVMSLTYGLYYARLLEDELLDDADDSNILDYIMFG